MNNNQNVYTLILLLALIIILILNYPYSHYDKEVIFFTVLFASNDHYLFKSLQKLKDLAHLSLQSSQGVFDCLKIVMPKSAKNTFKDLIIYPNVIPIYIPDNLIEANCWVLITEALKIEFLKMNLGKNLVYVELDMIFTPCITQKIREVFNHDFDLCCTYRGQENPNGSMNTGVLMYKNVSRKLISFENRCFKHSSKQHCRGGLNQITYDVMGLNNIPYYSKRYIYGIVILSVPKHIFNNTSGIQSNDACLYHFPGDAKKNMPKFYKDLIV